MPNGKVLLVKRHPRTDSRICIRPPWTLLRLSYILVRVREDVGPLEPSVRIDTARYITGPLFYSPQCVHVYSGCFGCSGRWLAIRIGRLSIGIRRAGRDLLFLFDSGRAISQSVITR